MIHDVMMTMIMKSDEDHFDRGAWWPSGSALAFRSEGRGFGPAGRHAISPAWGPRHCSVPGRAWFAEFGGECRSPGDGAGYWFGRPCFLLK